MKPVALLLLVCGCKGQEPDTGPASPTETGPSSETEPPETEPPPSGFTSCDGVVALSVCPSDALVVDGAGGVTIFDVPLTWTWSPACFQSVAAPIYVQVPPDATSVTVTTDAGVSPVDMDVLRDGAVLLESEARLQEARAVEP